MKPSQTLTSIFVLMFLSSAAFSEDGGVITGGPNASPSEQNDDQKQPSEPDLGSIIGVHKKVEPVIVKPNPPSNKAPEASQEPSGKPWILYITEKDFERLAIHSIRTKAEEIYVNDEVGVMTPHTVDVLNRKINGLNHARELVELQQVEVLGGKSKIIRTTINFSAFDFSPGFSDY